VNKNRKGAKDQSLPMALTARSTDFLRPLLRRDASRDRRLPAIATSGVALRGFLAAWGFLAREDESRRICFAQEILTRPKAVYLYSPLGDRGAMKVEIVGFISEFEKRKILETPSDALRYSRSRFQSRIRLNRAVTV
jgi:hypothetical protein